MIDRDDRIAFWLSRDPIAERGGLNLYGYVGNNPIGSIDPLGLDNLNLINPKSDWLGKRLIDIRNLTAAEYSVGAHGSPGTDRADR